MTAAKLLYSIVDKGRKIKVWQDSDLRWLEFGDGLIQTEIDLTRPDFLPESFSRAMLSGALFNSQVPKTVLLAGTGGGSTARYFAHRFPEVEGDAIESSTVVLDIARRFFDCPYEGNWQLIQADIRDYVQHCSRRYDLIVMDIAIGPTTPEWLTCPVFLKRCRQLLTQTGHIAINIIAEDELHFHQKLSEIEQIFDRQTVYLSLTEHRNIIVLAFNSKQGMMAKPLSLDEIEAQWKIEFSQFYQQILKDNANSGVV